MGPCGVSYVIWGYRPLAHIGPLVPDYKMGLSMFCKHIRGNFNADEQHWQGSNVKVMSLGSMRGSMNYAHSQFCGYTY